MHFILWLWKELKAREQTDKAELESTKKLLKEKEYKIRTLEIDSKSKDSLSTSKESEKNDLARSLSKEKEAREKLEQDTKSATKGFWKLMCRMPNDCRDGVFEEQER